MYKSITVKAETVEEALKQALELTGLTMDEVHVEIVSNPGRRLFGLKKVLAEVSVTEIQREEQPVQQPETEDEEELLFAGARIRDKWIDTRFAEHSYPVVTPSEHVQLLVNNEEVRERTVLLPTDRVSVTARNEHHPPQFMIQLIEHDMLALAIVTPGRTIHRSLVETDWEPTLVIRTTEQVETYNNLDPQQIVNELKALGIEKGLLFPNIKLASETTEIDQFIVAQGVRPVESVDADLEVRLPIEDEQVNLNERVDFREMNKITTVTSGQLIATYVPPTFGVEGKDLFGKVIPVKAPKDIVLRLGPNIQRVGNDIYAAREGKPTIEWRRNVVKINVNPEYRHPGDVDIESGNIHFDGDVWIGGQVHPSMFIGASGSITVVGNITKASIRGTESVTVQGNVFSSSVTVGVQEKAIALLVDELQEILEYLSKIKGAIDQLLAVRNELDDEVSPFRLNQMLHLLLEKKYNNFSEANKRFIQVVKNHSQRLEEEWLELAEALYNLFANPLREDHLSMQNLRNLIKDAEWLVDIYSVDPSPETMLQLPFALNSILYSNGGVHITSQGVYNCSITAKRDIVINGVCRGGEIIGGRQITLHEAGSPAAVRTVIETGPEGSIKIDKAHPGTEIQVGGRKHVFIKERRNVFARLDSEGFLVLF